MLSHVDMREASIWVQADKASTLSVAYSEDGSNNRQTSAPVATDPTMANTARLILDQVEPGKTYRYQVLQDGQPVGDNYTFKTPPNFYEITPPPDFTLAVGGAHYVMEEGYEPPYQLLGGGYGIFRTIAQSKPDLMLWLGNTTHLRRSDFTTQSGVFKRYSTARTIPELAELLATVPHYATWGDADYSPNHAGRSYSFRSYSENAFKAFWPQPVAIESLDGIATRFRYSDAEFFVLDVRSYRDDAPTSARNRTILGEAQIDWLREEIIRSDATFKVIVAGAPILNPADSSQNLSYAEQEHTELLAMFRSERISGLFFISGGKYHGELTKLVHANSYNLHDLTVGPLTAAPRENEDELNYFRVPSTNTLERHFALVEFSGPEEDRQLTMRIMSMEGDELWNRTLKANDLQPAAE
ncbi:MAG: alkaline phosphatase D family protein [Coraliomargarita sp.]